MQNCLEAIRYLQMQKWMTFHLGAFCVALRCREILARLVEADTTMENGSVRPIFEEMLINAYLWSHKSTGTNQQGLAQNGKGTSHIPQVIQSLIRAEKKAAATQERENRRICGMGQKEITVCHRININCLNWKVQLGFYSLGKVKFWACIHFERQRQPLM